MKMAAFVLIGAFVAIFAAAACDTNTSGLGGGGAGGYGGGGGASCFADVGDPCDSSALVDECCAPLTCTEQNQCE